jgi:hypothetical protein
VISREGNSMPYKSLEYNSHELPEDLLFLPTWFRESEVINRMQETELDGYLVLGLPNGLVPNEPCNTNLIPFDVMYGTQQVQNLDQIMYYPADAQWTRDRVDPLIFPDKLLHRVVRVI